MKKVINGKAYNTETAILIATDEYKYGTNRANAGRNTYLYKTQKGNYFVHTTTQWQGEIDTIEPVSKEEAMYIYEDLYVNVVEYEEAFGVTPEEA